MKTHIQNDVTRVSVLPAVGEAFRLRGSSEVWLRIEDIQGRQSKLAMHGIGTIDAVNLDAGRVGYVLQSADIEILTPDSQQEVMIFRRK